MPKDVVAANSCWELIGYFVMKYALMICYFVILGSVWPTLCHMLQARSRLGCGKNAGIFLGIFCRNFNERIFGWRSSIFGRRSSILAGLGFKKKYDSLKRLKTVQSHVRSACFLNQRIFLKYGSLKRLKTVQCRVGSACFLNKMPQSFVGMSWWYFVLLWLTCPYYCT